MTVIEGTKQRFRAGLKFAAPSALMLLLTAVHHAYGAIIYHTPWRFHVVIAAVPLALIILLMLRSPKSRWHTAAGVLIMAFPVLLIGIFEGGYNHVAKNIVYFTAGEAKMRALFPAPAYEIPSDLLFELSGIGQFLLVPFAAAGGVKILRAARQRLRTDRSSTSVVGDN